MSRTFATLTLGVLLAVLVAGCGSSSSSSTSTGTAASSGTATATSGATSTPSESNSGGGSTTTSPAGSGGSSSSGSSETPDNSIQTYGSAAAGGEKAELSKAAFAFFSAMAARDYAGVCAGLSASNRTELQAFLKAKHQAGGCAAILKTLIPRAVPEARKAAQGTLTAVRVKGDTAFVLFRPKGGAPSYFVLKREGGAWKAISLAPGTPLNPLTGLGK